MVGVFQTEGGYCDNFRSLYYSHDASGKPLALVSKAMADAYAEGKTAQSGDESRPVPMMRYVFMDDPYVINNELWKEEFGLFALPVHPKCSLYWVGTEGIFYKKLPREAERPPVITPRDSPLYPGQRDKWIRL